MKDEKLKSCPFCGLPHAEIVVNGYENYYQAWCRRCGASAGKCYWGNKRKLDLGGIKYSSMEDARENAIKKWNMRLKTVELHFREDFLK